jgi:hypothetical protein
MFLFNDFTLKAQESFKGRLDYSVSYKYLDKKLDINNLPVDTVTYFVAPNGDYTSYLKQKDDTIFSLYKAQNLMIYGFGEEYVTGVDVTIDLEEKLGYKPQVELLPDTVQIGDTKCQVVKVKWRTGEYKYYFNKDLLKINASLYKGYEYDQWYSFLLISGSLPIRIDKITYNIIEVTFNLESYSNYDVDEDMFQLPKLKEEKEMSKIYLNKKIYYIVAP